jgi:hypothetical protein
MKPVASCSLVIALLFFVLDSPAQKELHLILDKHGTFEILSRTDYTSPDCDFNKAETTANFQKIKELVNVMCKNPVLSELKGFDGRARIYNMANCHEEGIYGVPARISFEFAAWYRMKDGREVRGLIEPPEWSVYINAMQPGWLSGFSRKPDFFAVPKKKEAIAPGIDVYDGECYVVYNPDRPDYWLPVTVKEAFDVVFAENKKLKDNIQPEYAMKFLNEEWATIPQDDWNKPATFSGMLSRVGTKTGFPLIMKLNPAYWDKSRPKSDIQFITFRMIGNKQTNTFLENVLTEVMSDFPSTCHRGIFTHRTRIQL